jgi:nucleotide-binding universal stress UspA family protein
MRHAALLTESPASSTTPQSGGGGSVKRILVPVDARGLSAAALGLAARLCSETQGTLRIVHVRLFDPPVRNTGRFYPETSEAATAVLDSAVSSAWRCGTTASGVVVEATRRHLAEAICAAATNWNADVIVMSRRPRRAFTRLVLGSVADGVMRRASRPVVIVRPDPS